MKSVTLSPYSQGEKLLGTSKNTDFELDSHEFSLFQLSKIVKNLINRD